MKSTTESAWTKYRRQLLSFIRSKVNSPEDAEDILNEVFVRLIKQSDASAIPENVSAWLYRVTRNTIVDYYRARRPLERLPEDLSGENPDADSITRLSKCVLPMIQAMPKAYRQPLLLSEIEGKKQKQVAAELGLTLPAVKSRILRGREKLHQSMIRCCRLHHNSAGVVVDYEQKSSKYCDDCSD